MGQYYKPLILNKEGKIEKSFYPHEYIQGLKMMEHSYFRNPLMNAVENTLIDNPGRLIWAGDYSDKDADGTGNNHYFVEGKNHATRVEPSNELMRDLPDGLFVYNNTKKEYYSRDKMKTLNCREDEDVVWSVNPLSLLTQLTDDESGGDYHGTLGREFLGRWAEDEIEISAVPRGDDYKEIIPRFRA